MEISQAATLSPILLVVGALLFVLLFVVILQTPKMSSFFSGGISYLMATCVSLLCVFSLFRTFMGEKGVTKGGNGNMVDFILLPYAALAISVLLLLLSMAFTRLCKTSSYWFLGKPYRRYDPDLDDGRDCAPDTLGSRRIRKSRRLKKAMKGTTDSSDTQELRVPQVVAGRTNIRVSNGEGRRL